MYELMQLSHRCYYVECPSKIGLIRISDQDVCLIDSGNDKETGRKVRKILDEKGWRLKAIYNTHSHADHIGGNKYLQGQSGCNIYAPPINAAFTKYPILEPSFLYGACPPKELRNKFLLAAESEVTDLSEDVLPDGVKAIPLPGHFFDMVGYESDDGIIFLADALLSREILDKYQLNVIYDVEQYLATLEHIKTLQAKFFVPSHGMVTEDITSLAQYNIEKVHEVAQKICHMCKEPLNFEAVLQKIFTEYGLTMNFNQYVLVGMSVHALLSWLKNMQQLETIFQDNMLLWKASS